MKTKITAAAFLFLCFATISSSLAGGSAFRRTSLPDSVRDVYEHAWAVKTMRAERLSENMEFHVALTMRNYADLQARLSSGEIIPPAEMAEKYLPLASDYQAIVAWLQSQGLQVTESDPNRLSIFVKGPVNRIQTALEVEFARVSVAEGDFTSAITSPTLPSSIAGAVLGINGLQPHLHPHKLGLKRQGISSSQPPYSVRQILSAYNATGLNTDGTGEKIAILIDTVPAHSDLTTFWTNNGVPQTLSNIEEVNVTGAALPATSGEETLDVEWTSALAPAAKVRIYATSSLSFTNLDRGFQKLISDLPTQTQIHALSISLGLGETEISSAQLRTDSQYLAMIASYGVSVFVSTGDDGATTDGVLQPSYFSTDPSVTAVGGTTLNVSSSGAVTSETGWGGSGGGKSTYFSRPAWQVGSGLPAGTKRVVPDVAAVADPNTGAYVVWNGQAYEFGGTSLSAPAWAGFSALINQARIAHQQSPLGLLNSKLYPLIGTSAFRDVTSGSNGYPAGAGYDMVTGLGVPHVGNLLLALTSGTTSSANPPIAAAITTPPLSQTVVAGRATSFSVVATGSPSPTYQWTKNGAAISGATKSTFTIPMTQLTDAGNYAVTVTNTAGSQTSSTAVLTVGLSYTTTAGFYYGLITSTDAATNGLARITTTRNGVFTGTIVLNGLSHTVRGLLDNSGKWSGSMGPANGQPILVTLQLALDGSNQITIAITNGSLSATGTANRAVYNARTNFPAQRGTYTLVLVPDPNHPEASSPQGFGYGIAKVDASGVVRIAGMLGDGTLFSQTAYLSAAGTCALYLPLYHNLGYIAGTVTFDATQQDSDLGCQLAWVKSATSTGLYPGGFSVQTHLIGSLYVPPARGQTTLNFGTLGTATIYFQSASLASIHDEVAVSASRVTPLIAQPLPLKFSISNPSGYFSGSVVLPGLTKATGFGGVILQKNNAGGAGIFVTSEGSGAVTVIPNP